MIPLHVDLIGWFILITGYFLLALGLVCLLIALISKLLTNNPDSVPFKLRWNYSLLLGSFVLLAFGIVAIIFGTFECGHAHEITHRLDHVYLIYGGTAIGIAVAVVIRRLKKIKKQH